MTALGPLVTCDEVGRAVAALAAEPSLDGVVWPFPVRIP